MRVGNAYKSLLNINESKYCLSDHIAYGTSILGVYFSGCAEGDS